MAFLYWRAGRLTAKNGGFRPGQWGEFVLWTEHNPRVGRWMRQIGLVCLDALAPLTDMAGPSAGARPVISTYRIRAKGFTTAGHFGRILPHDVVQAFKARATSGLSFLCLITHL